MGSMKMILYVKKKNNKSNNVVGWRKSFVCLCAPDGEKKE